MPRLKPTTKLDVIGNLDLNPERAIGDFIESKQQEEFFVKPPNWDSAGDSIELLSIRNEREHLAMIKLQDEMLENAKRQAIVNSNRTKELYKTQTKLRKRFIEVNGFIKDCQDKKSVAEKKVNEEKQLHKIHLDNIELYKNRIAELTEFREVLKVTVQEFEPYEKVIKDVVAKDDVMGSVKECMDRCDALMLAQTEITRMQQEKMQQIEEMRKEMVKITNEAALTVLGLKNELTELERTYNQAQAECLKWEKILANAKDCISENDLSKDRILDGIQHMYRLLCKRRGLDPVLQKHEVEKQLDFVKDEIEILQAVVLECAE